MKRIIRTLSLFLAFLSLGTIAPQNLRAQAYADTKLSPEERAADLVSRLTLEEKASLDEEFSFAKLSGGFAGNSPLELSHPNQAHAVQKRKNFPSILWNLFVMGQTFLSID